MVGKRNKLVRELAAASSQTILIDYREAQSQSHPVTVTHHNVDVWRERGRVSKLPGADVPICEGPSGEGPRLRVVAGRTTTRPRGDDSREVGSEKAAVFAFVGLRGGTGKTTAAILCASEWLARGRRVLLLDGAAHLGIGFASEWAARASGRGWPVPTVTSSLEVCQQPDVLSSFHVIVADGPSGNTALQRAMLVHADVAVIPVGPGRFDEHVLRQEASLLSDANTKRAFLLRNQSEAFPRQVAFAETVLHTLSTHIGRLRAREYAAIGSRFQSARVKALQRQLVDELADSRR